MESGGAFGQSQLISKLAQAHEQMRQLRDQLDQPSSSESRKALLESSIASIEQAILIAKPSASQGENHSTEVTTGNESPQSVNDSPTGRTFSQAFKNQECQEMSKKRKAMQKWTNPIQVYAGASFEGPPDDGSSWRKYGQKDILGAKHPRGYYRCTHRHSQGCLATKQVQRSDKDPSILEVKYRGEHTCFQRPSVNQENSQGNIDHQLLASLKSGLEIKTEGLENIATSSFSFPSTPINYANSEKHNHIFSAPSTLENQFGGTNCFSPFISPARSESDYFSLPTSFGEPAMNFHTEEYDLNCILSAATSATNSPMGVDFPLEGINFNADFPFDSHFFS